MASVGIASGSHDDQGASSSRKPVSIDLESIRLHMSSLAARLQSRVSLDTLRPLPMFLGVNPDMGFCLSAGAFTPPVKKVDKATPEKISSRLQLNFKFFLTNYALVAAMVAVVVALMHPGMLFFVAVVYGLWYLHSFMIKHELLVFGIRLHTLLSIQQRFYLLFVITTLVILWKCLLPTLTFLLISGIIILAHAFLRDPKHLDMMSSELSGDDDEEDYERVDEEAVGGIGSAGGSNSSGSGVLVERTTTPRGDVI